MDYLIIRQEKSSYFSGQVQGTILEKERPKISAVSSSTAAAISSAGSATIGKTATHTPASTRRPAKKTIISWRLDCAGQNSNHLNKINNERDDQPFPAELVQQGKLEIGPDQDRKAQ